MIKIVVKNADKTFKLYFPTFILSVVLKKYLNIETKKILAEVKKYRHMYQGIPLIEVVNDEDNIQIYI